MTAFADILRHTVARLPYRARRWVLSGFFGLVVVAVFYALRLVFPETTAFREQLLTAFFVALSVFVLFPARDRISQMLFRKREQTALFGGDFHHLDVLAGNFTVDSLIHEVTPELLDWLRVRSGSLAILRAEGRDFHCYEVRSSRFGNASIASEHIMPGESLEDIRHYLKRRRTVVYADELDLPPALRSFLNMHRAQVLVPFSYRTRLLGFLILHQSPEQKYATIGLDTYAGKAAVGIQNYILSVRVLDGGMLRHEKRVASKIQRLLQFTTIPRIPGLQVKLLKRKNYPCIVEFFPDQEDERIWYMAILCAPRSTGSSSLLLFGMLGYLYSYVHRGARLSLSRLVDHLRRDQDAATQYRMEVLAAEINIAEQTMTVIVDGQDLDLRHADHPATRLISPGWRNYLDLESERALRISFGSEPLLEIEGRPTESAR